MIVFPEMKHLLTIRAMEEVDFENRARVIGVDITTEFTRVTKEPEPTFGSEIVDVLDDDKRVTAEVREGMEQLSKFLKSHPQAVLALKFMQEQLYMEARQKGVEDAAEILHCMATERSI